jgi:hypothetical protein
MASYTPFLEYASSPDIGTATELISSSEDIKIVSTIIIANGGSSSVSVDMYLADSVGNKLVNILSGYSVGTGRSQTLDVNSLNLPATYKIMVVSDGQNVDFCASGVQLSNQ